MRRASLVALIPTLLAAPQSAGTGAEAVVQRARTLALERRSAEARSLIETEMQRARGAGDRLTECWMLFGTGLVLSAEHRLDAAVPFQEQAAELAAQLKDVRLEGLARAALGHAQGVLGDLDKARVNLRAAADRLEAAGEQERSAQAWFDYARAEPNAAARIANFEEAYQRAQRAGHVRLQGRLLQDTG